MQGNNGYIKMVAKKFKCKETTKSVTVVVNSVVNSVLQQQKHTTSYKL
jgi:hypothetical protein